MSRAGLSAASILLLKTLPEKLWELSEPATTAATPSSTNRLASIATCTSSAWAMAPATVLWITTAPIRYGSASPCNTRQCGTNGQNNCAQREEEYPPINTSPPLHGEIYT